jgi:hypothetical protein
MEIPSFCSVYKKDQVYFGGYPTKEWFQTLCDIGITLFVDLTTRYEKQSFPYVYTNNPMPGNVSTMSFPIRDNYIPYDTDSFRGFIIKLGDQIQKGVKIYIHCRGGHGRSGMTIASLMCYVDNIHPIKALDVTTRMHLERKDLKLKYRSLKCPDNYIQRNYVTDLFYPVYISDHFFKKKIAFNLFDFITMTKTRPLLNTKEHDSVIVEILMNFRSQLHRYDLARA